MSEFSREQISALMDGELADNPLYTVNALKNSEEYRKSWCHYHLIGETLRGNLPSHYDPQLAERISRAISEEPAVMAPEPGRFSLGEYFKPVMGFAIAASVTVAIIFGVRYTSEAPPINTVQTAAVQQQPSTTTPVNNPRIATAQVATDKPRQASRTYKIPIDAQSRLNRYLVNHNEYRTNTGVQGMLPYVRIVAHEVGE